MIPTLTEFRDRIPTNPDDLHDQVIGKGAVVSGPFGDVPMVYADYVASGRALSLIEDFVRDRVLPYYANSHTEASCCGGAMTRMRREARDVIAQCCGAGPDHAVVFTGSGATNGINRLVHLLGVRRRWYQRPVTVLIGPYEHHSNILPWREAGARVIEVPESPDGGPDLTALDRLLAQARGPVIGAFSAMSNVSGIVTDVAEVTRRLKRAGAIAVWDYAGAGPYLPINMLPAPDAAIDAVVISPHKFVGGPGASGVMILRRDAVRSARPSLPGGGTVRFVSSKGQDYHPAVEVREEAGTPNVVGDLRAAMCFMVKAAIGDSEIVMRNRELACRAIETLRDAARIELLGNDHCDRVPVLSFRVSDGQGGHYHQQLATRVLSDRFGIQARGGCACAGPYVLRLLDYDAARTDQVRDAIMAGDEVSKPGFVRLNLSYLMTDKEVGFILESIAALPKVLDEAAGLYGCDTTRAIFTPAMAAE